MAVQERKYVENLWRDNGRRSISVKSGDDCKDYVAMGDVFRTVVSYSIGPPPGLWLRSQYFHHLRHTDLWANLTRGSADLGVIFLSVVLQVLPYFLRGFWWRTWKAVHYPSHLWF
jgi:hypothetical protein